MMSAAAVMTRPVLAWPWMIAFSLSFVIHPLLVHARDQEDLVVHGEAEENRDHHDRQV